MNVTHEEFTLYWTEAMPVVSAFINAMVPDFHEAQDVIQEVAVTLFNKMDDYDKSRPFVAWAIGVARNKIKTSRSKQVRHPLLYNTDVVEAVGNMCEEMAPQVGLRMQALNHCVRELKLKGRSRNIFLLRYQSLLMPRQIASRTGIASGTVRVMLNRIRDLLRKCIDSAIKEQKAWS